MTTDLETVAETRGPTRRSTGAVVGAASAARDALEDVTSAIPSAVADGRAAIDQLARRLDTEPETNLVALLGFSAGATLGLLVGGAPRLVAVTGLLPMIALGFALLDRQRPGA
jgi:dienelactone hydrolase